MYSLGNLGSWIAGYFTQTPGVGYIEIVQQQDAATLFPIIHDHVASGTVIHRPMGSI